MRIVNVTFVFSQNVNITGVVANLFFCEHSMGRRFLWKSSTIRINISGTFQFLESAFFPLLRKILHFSYSLT